MTRIVGLFWALMAVIATWGGMVAVHYAIPVLEIYAEGSLAILDAVTGNGKNWRRCHYDEYYPKPKRKNKHGL